MFNYVSLRLFHAPPPTSLVTYLPTSLRINPSPPTSNLGHPTYTRTQANPLRDTLIIPATLCTTGPRITPSLLGIITCITTTAPHRPKPKPSLGRAQRTHRAGLTSPYTSRVRVAARRYALLPRHRHTSRWHCGASSTLELLAQAWAMGMGRFSRSAVMQWTARFRHHEIMDFSFHRLLLCVTLCIFPSPLSSSAFVISGHELYFFFSARGVRVI